MTSDDLKDQYNSKKQNIPYVQWLENQVILLDYRLKNHYVPK